MPCKNSKTTKGAKPVTKPAPAPQASFLSSLIGHVTSMAERWGVQEGVDDEIVEGFCEFIKKDIRGDKESLPAKQEKTPLAVVILLDAYAKEHGIFYPPSVKETVHDALADAGISTSAKRIKAKWDGLTFPKGKLDEVKETLSDFDLSEEPASEFGAAPWDLPVEGKKPVAKKGPGKKGPAKKKPSEPEFETNKWGNLWDPETELVIHTLKVGKKTTYVAIGTQNTEANVAKSKKDPWTSVYSLDEQSPTLEGVEPLTEELAKKFPKKLREKIEEFELVPEEEEEEDDESEESEESE